MKFTSSREINGFMLSVTYLVNILPAYGKGSVTAIRVLQFPRFLIPASEARVHFTCSSEKISFPPSLTIFSRYWRAGVLSPLLD